MPADHWIWKITDSRLRSQEVKHALAFYRDFSEVRQVAAELKGIVMDRGVF